MTTANAVLAKKYLTPDEVEVEKDVEYDEAEGWNGIIRIGSLTAGDLIEWTEAGDDPTKKREAGLRLIQKSWVDGEGNRIGRPEEKVIKMLRTKSHKLTDKVVDKILALNGLMVKGRAAEAKKD